MIRQPCGFEEGRRIETGQDDAPEKKSWEEFDVAVDKFDRSRRSRAGFQPGADRALPGRPTPHRHSRLLLGEILLRRNFTLVAGLPIL
ncbi:hypothetical protein [Achromobacter xylosoxidans]|uniref:Uncharacterized protein n=1 Tax=Alcaligenes xylosoxydans xylosoxydans TaxID=85698 RepID=A0A9X3L065_ALCXX|nr:hypothetical protein [Achromobacter xylosoxidans]MCZ8403585.1 hypothetical protein [Achromobacter xylosoxidans]